VHQIPNIISIIRILLVLPIVLALWSHEYPQALLLMFVAGVSDAIDGGLARRFDWTSELGRILDPLADKILVGVTIVVFTLQGQLPLWAALIVLSRDGLILLGAGAYRLLFEKVGFTPTFLSKANTAIQISTLLLLLLNLCEFGPLSRWAGAVVDPHLFYVLAVLGVASGADYVVTWGQRAWHQGFERGKPGNWSTKVDLERDSEATPRQTGK
jgi:cardiolipin synthase